LWLARFSSWLSFRPTFLAVSFVLLLHNLDGQELERYEFEHPQMGTLFRIILFAPDPEIADSVAQTAFARVDQLNEILSDYDPESELNRLSASAGSDHWVEVSDDLWQVLLTSTEMARVTQGAFDITVGPLSRLWRRAFRQKKYPDQNDLADALALVGPENIHLHPSEKKILLRLEGMKLDLGGIAKGYALDQAMIVLKSEGIMRALVDGGGDVLVSGPPPGKKGWKVLYQKYSSDNELVLDSLIVSNQAVATSGDHYRFLVWEGKRYSHIIDPRTGLGLTNQRLVTVVAPTGMVADALASACSVMKEDEKESALEFISGLKVMVSSATTDGYSIFNNR